MKKQIDYACLIEMVAEMEGCSVAEIRQEIEKAMLDAMQNKDPSVQEHWKAMSPNGKIPTVEEVMQYLMKLNDGRIAKRPALPRSALPYATKMRRGIALSAAQVRLFYGVAGGKVRACAST